jgi:hypothetical protein
MYAPTADLPQAAVNSLCPPAGCIGASDADIAARLGNLLVWVLLLSVTIRIAGRRAALFRARLPVARPYYSCSASANADALTNGLCWWLVAALLSGQYRRVRGDCRIRQWFPRTN